MSHIPTVRDIADKMDSIQGTINAEEFLRSCHDKFLRSLKDSFTYDDMLDHYCDAVNYLGELGSLISGCLVRTCYSDDYITVTLVFCDSSGQPIKMNDSDYFVLNNARSLDAKFLQFMKGRSEVYFTPTIQEIVQRMKKNN